MKKQIITCDHCGKELDPMCDYIDKDIDSFVGWYEVDLCSDCFHELNGIIAQFINKNKYI